MNEAVRIGVDVSCPIGELKHRWNYIGYDECNYSYSPGGSALIAKIGHLGEPYYIRTHHMFCTGNRHGFYKWGSTNIYTENADGHPVYDFETVDRIIDVWLSNNCIPFFELGFMPKDLADPREAENGAAYNAAYGSVNEYQLRGWCQPPKDYDKWYDLICRLAEHLLERYGLQEMERWYFELWNEPDIFYWHGTTEEYCKLFDYTEAALHKILPTVRLGGPATTGCEDPGKGGSLFLRSFLAHTRDGVNYYSGEKGTRLDFTSFHTKGGIYNFEALAEKQLPSVRTFLANIQTQSRIILEYGYGHLECILSEADPDGWAAGGRFDNFNLNFRNTEYYASWVMSAYKNLFDLAKRLKMDIRPLIWAFMFEGERCFEGTRTLSTQGIDKAVFNLFRILARLGTQRIELSSSLRRNPMTEEEHDKPEIDGWAFRDSTDGFQVLVYCHHDDWDIKKEFDVSLSIENIPDQGPVSVMHYRIDSEHSNGYPEWERCGKPDWPDEKQRKKILARSGLELLQAPEVYEPHTGRLEITFPLPIHSISLLEIRFLSKPEKPEQISDGIQLEQ